MRKSGHRPVGNSQLSLFDSLEGHKNNGGTTDGSDGWGREFLEKLKAYENDSDNDPGRDKSDAGQRQ